MKFVFEMNLARDVPTLNGNTLNVSFSYPERYKNEPYQNTMSVTFEMATILVQNYLYTVYRVYQGGNTYSGKFDTDDKVLAISYDWMSIRICDLIDSYFEWSDSLNLEDATRIAFTWSEYPFWFSHYRTRHLSYSGRHDYKEILADRKWIE
jgi:hypothetical protein